MSLSDEERRTMVEHELNKAHKTMEQVYVLANNEFWDGAANRLYYAAFHAVCALLIYDGISVHTHHGVNSMLYMQYVKTGKLSAGLAKLFSSLQTMREKSDYNCSFNASKEIIEPLIEPTNNLIRQITLLIGEWKFILAEGEDWAKVEG